MYLFTKTLGDTLDPLYVQLKQKNNAGVLTAVNLSSKRVKFKLISVDGTIVVDFTTDNVSIDSSTDGKVNYDFQSTDISSTAITPGIYFGWFQVVDSSSNPSTFPPGGRELKITFHGTT